MVIPFQFIVNKNSKIFNMFRFRYNTFKYNKEFQICVVVTYSIGWEYSIIFLWILILNLFTNIQSETWSKTLLKLLYKVPRSLWNKNMFVSSADNLILDDDLEALAISVTSIKIRIGPTTLPWGALQETVWLVDSYPPHLNSKAYL